METNEQSILRIDPATATQLMALARKWKTPYAKSLQLMLDFFKRNGLSPTEDLRPNLKSMESRLDRRIGSLIAILRSIEQTQTRPTHDLMQQLAQALSPAKKPLLVEKKLLQSKKFSPGQMTHNQSQGIDQKPDSNALGILKPIFQKAEIYPSGTGGYHLHLSLSAKEFQQIRVILKADDYDY